MTRLYIEKALLDTSSESAVRKAMIEELNKQIGQHVALDTRYTLLIIEEPEKRRDGLRLLRYSAELYPY